MPKVRFTDWSELSEADSTIAQNGLGYIKYSWNVIGENPVEKWAFSDLYTNEATAVNNLGISSAQWDCWVNHYHGYWWSDLETMGITAHLEVLGWTEKMWESDGALLPDTEELYWVELSVEQIAAARQICYTEELWNGIPLKKWG